MKYKNNQSVLVVIYAQNSGRVLMLQRRDDTDFWQSVTGSLEPGETPKETAMREVWEEVRLKISENSTELFDCNESVEFEIFPHFRYKYAPNVTHCREHWFLLSVEQEFIPELTEHLAFQWVSPTQAIKITKSPNNAEAIRKYLLDLTKIEGNNMAGHSKWANIKHRKAAQDAQRGKIFTKLIRELVTAAKIGGGDVGSNPRLRAAVDKALSNNMTRDTINRAIERGVGGGDDTNMETKIYEGYGPGGTAVMVECLSDNANRTISQVRPSFTKCGGNLGTEGSVGYLFSKKGLILVNQADEDALMEAAIEAGADDVQPQDDGSFEIYTAWEELGSVRDGIEAAGFKVQEAEVTMIPSTTVDLDLETAPKLLRLIDMLEDCDDVQNVYHNGEISDEVAAQL